MASLKILRKMRTRTAIQYSSIAKGSNALRSMNTKVIVRLEFDVLATGASRSVAIGKTIAMLMVG